LKLQAKGPQQYLLSQYGRTWPAPPMPEFFTVLHKPHIACKYRPNHDFGKLIEIQMKTPTGAISCSANFRWLAYRTAQKLGSHLNHFTVIYIKR
jgi:hypothetical protein